MMLASEPSHSRGTLAHRATRRWALAGLAGPIVCVVLEHLGVMSALPVVADGAIVIACGWLAILLCAPWRGMNALVVDDQPSIEKLAKQLQSIVEGDRNIALTDLVIDRDDDLGRLSRAAHDLAAEAVRNRRHSRILHQRLDHTVERRTKRATAHLERQASTDPLTGLGNRRALERCLAELLGPRASHDQPLTVMAIDLDLFKLINDELGHEVGDTCLRALADVLASSLRREDHPIRLGGDEFIVIMPEQRLDIGKMAAQRIARLFTQMPWPHAKVPRPTISFGLATVHPGERIEASDLLRRADAALYASKQAGRSAITAFGEHRAAA